MMRPLYQTIQDEYYDGKQFLRLVQTITNCDVALHFGPLSTTLAELLKDGFELEAVSLARHIVEIDPSIHFRIRLVRGAESYKVANKVSLRDIEKSGDLGSFVKERNLSNKHNVDLNANSMTLIESIIKKCGGDTTILLNALLKAHPPKRNKQLMIGNQTVAEYVDMLADMILQTK